MVTERAPVRAIKRIWSYVMWNLKMWQIPDCKYKSIYSTDIFREPREVTLTKQQGGLGFNIVGGECDSEALFLQKLSLILQLTHSRWGWGGYFCLLHPGWIPCWYMSMAEKGRSGRNIILATLNLTLSNISFADPKCQPDRHSKSFPWCSGQGIIIISMQLYNIHLCKSLKSSKEPNDQRACEYG